MSGRVINLNDKPRPDEFVYIGRHHPRGSTIETCEFRQSPWANPFGVKRYGREEALRRY